MIEDASDTFCILLDHQLIPYIDPGIGTNVNPR